MGKRSRDKARYYRYALIVLCVLFLVSAGLFAWYLQESKHAEEQYAASDYGILEYAGKRYRQKEQVETLLILGLDKFDRPENYEGYVNNQQADFLALLILDKERKTCDVLHLNRDTMTKIRRLGVSGDDVGSFTGQLALAHTYGSGGSDSCLNAVKAVSDLLGGVKIDHYMSLTMDAVGVVNDAVGGVSVEILDDFTHLDPAMIQGQQVTLMGDQALLYVRSRGSLADSSNLRRMERQRQYMDALYQQVILKQQANEEFLARTLLKVSDSFMSDCSVNQLDALAQLLVECELGTVTALEGEAVAGEQYMEFYPDQDAMLQTVITLLYEED